MKNIIAMLFLLLCITACGANEQGTLVPAQLISVERLYGAMDNKERVTVAQSGTSKVVTFVQDRQLYPRAAPGTPITLVRYHNGAYKATLR